MISSERDDDNWVDREVRKFVRIQRPERLGGSEGQDV
jgi:hypothetical protein